MNFTNANLKTQIALKATLLFIFIWLIFIYLWYQQISARFSDEIHKTTEVQSAQFRTIIDNEAKNLSINLKNISNLLKPEKALNYQNIEHAVKTLSISDAIRLYQYYHIDGSLIFSENSSKNDTVSRGIIDKLIESPVPIVFFSCSDICYLNLIMPAQATRLDRGILRIAMPIDDLLNNFRAISSSELIALYTPLDKKPAKNRYIIDSYTKYSAYEIFLKLHHDSSQDSIQIYNNDNRVYLVKKINHGLNDKVIFILVNDLSDLQKNLYGDLWRIFTISSLILIITLLLIYYLLTRSLSQLVELKVIMALIGQSRFHEAEKKIASSQPRRISQEINLVYKTTSRLISQLRDKHNRLKYVAEHDSLTGLVTRTKLREHLNLYNDPLLSKFALVGIDLDYFKIINDTLGHSAGDQLLVAVARVLKNNIDEADIASRIGGDEFMLMVTYTDQQTLFEKLTTIKQKISALQVTQYSINNVNVSLGVALFPEHTSNIEQLIVYADAAMYENKKYKRKPFHLYNGQETLLEQERQRQYWNTFIIESLQRNNILIHFQPIYSVMTNSPYSYEALVRFHNTDTDQLIFPGKVIPHAEASHTIIRIDRQVLRLAIQKAAKAISKPIIMVNLSNVSISSLHMKRFLQDTLFEFNLPPDRIILEVTESSEIKDISQVITFIQDLKNIGVRFALDDFGAGFSSFFYLKSLTVDFLKIDQKIIKGLLVNKADDHIVSAIVLLAQQFNIKTVAEGIENKELLDTVKKYDIDYVQGFYLAKPSADTLETTYALKNNPLLKVAQ